MRPRTLQLAAMAAALGMTPGMGGAQVVRRPLSSANLGDFMERKSRRVEPRRGRRSNDPVLKLTPKQRARAKGKAQRAARKVQRRQRG